MTLAIDPIRTISTTISNGFIKLLLSNSNASLGGLAAELLDLAIEHRAAIILGRDPLEHREPVLDLGKLGTEAGYFPVVVAIADIDLFLAATGADHAVSRLHYLHDGANGGNDD